MSIDKKLLKCKICKKTCQNKNDLKSHKKVHNKFTCKFCSNTFASTSNLNRHVNLHTGQNSFKCEICSKKFTQKSNLVHHKRVHTGEKPFVCDICGKTFTRKNNLVYHKRAHTGERPYTCNICSKAFTQISNLITHKRLHNRNKEIECDICFSKFEKLHQLKLHMLKHTGNISHKCNQCHKECLSVSVLNQHLKIHNKKFKCYVCLKLFAFSRLLTNHKIKCKSAASTTKETQSTSGKPSKTINNKIKSERNFDKPNEDNIYDELQQQIIIKTEELSRLDPELDVIYVESEENNITIKKECDYSYEMDNIQFDAEEQDGELHSIIDIVKDEPQY